VLGQHLGSRATHSDGSEDDKHNRAVFEEQVDMVLDAWTRESIDHDSALWQIPFPYKTGITDWGMARAGATQRLGARDEVDASGAVRRVSVVPAPYSRPHPPVFVASNRSIETIEYAGRKGFIPTYFSGIGRAAEFGNAYVKAAQGSGREVAYGQNQATVRWPQIGRTRAEALRNLERYDVEIFKNFYSPTTGLPLPPNPVDGMAASGLWVVGDPEQVRDQFVAQWKEFPSEYVVLIYHYAQQPKESVIENVELFMRHVKPALDELTPYNT
jgi:alkanesulfonate monooxygenase SsuD/methylene tetrahydromethanopterin reductase-like flavin-dependent oxidoreductase (luciferase family)